MSEETGDLAPNRELEFVVVSSKERLQRYWGWVLAYGVLTFLLGLAMAVWPSETVKVVAFLLAFQLIVTGSMRLFVAIADSSIHRGVRWLLALAGLVAIVVGVLFAIEPLQTLGFVVVLAGSLLILVGLADLAQALMSEESEHRLWDVVGGVLSVGAGAFLVVSPERSLHLLVIVTSAWLLCFGFITVVSAFYLRSQDQAQAGTSSDAA